MRVIMAGPKPTGDNYRNLNFEQLEMILKFYKILDHPDTVPYNRLKNFLDENVYEDCEIKPWQELDPDMAFNH